MVIIKGFIESSFIDYPGKIACVIFTAGCNFYCHYCHNPELVTPEPPFLSEDQVLKKIDNKRDWIDGIVISGGEPTMHKDLPKFIEKVKEKGLMIKLDTNGSNPDMLKELLDKKLIDYVAMDIKAPLEKYDKITQEKCNVDDIRKSIDLIQHSGIPYEFRTTILPSLVSEHDLIKIGQVLEGSELFVIQQFRNEVTLDESYKTQPGYLKPQIDHFVRMLKPYFKKVISR
ncbi:7-carboxy-7-deazaguanine synthase [Candidatus Tiddalikarchaeum anstoanum]|nr:7-carboxy-7-deazaguanine synthase [Candidatus Tiddalikarchaeum anstoanum]